MLALVPGIGQAAESERWVLQNGTDQITTRFGSSDMVLVTGVPARETGELIPGSDVYVVPNADWSAAGDQPLHDVSNLKGLPNTVVGFEVVDQPVYLPYMRTGAYDLVFDNDQDGIYEQGFDEVVGFGAAPGFTVFYDGDHRTIDKAALKEKFARPVRDAAIQALRITAAVGAYQKADGAPSGFLKMGSAAYELSQNAATIPLKLHYRTEITDTGLDMLAGRVTGQQGAIEWAGGQLQAATNNLVKSVQGIVADPPDRNYTTVVEPDPVADRFDVSTDDPMYNAFAAVANTALVAAGQSNAVLHALERMDGAAADDAVPFVRLQADALRVHGAALEGTLETLRQRAGELAEALRNAGTPGALTDEQRALLRGTQERVTASGFNEEELTAFRDAGASEEKIAELKAELLRTPADQLTGSVDQTLDALATKAQAGQAGVRDASTQAANLYDDLTGDSPPVAQPDEMSVQAGATASIDVLANDTDPDGDRLHVSGAGPAGQGTVRCTAAGSCSYTAGQGASGSDNFQYTVDDGRGATSTGVVTVTIAAKNFPPTAAPDGLVTRKGAARAVDVLANDTDPNGDALHLSSNGQPSHGTAECTPVGRCTYTPSEGYSGQDSFSYVVEDTSAASATGAVSVTVNAENTGPVANAGPDLDGSEDTHFGLDGKGSHDPDGTIAEYRWEFGDGTEPVTQSDPSVGHTYGRPGAFTATLTVTDDAGATAKDTTVVTVANTAPTVSVLDFPRAPIGRTRAYRVSVSTGPSEATTVRADFGDGTETSSKVITGSSQVAFDHAYEAAGSYSITFTATDADGGTASVVSAVVVADAIADAGPDQQVREGDVVHLGGASTAPDAFTTVVWNFGDGSPAESGARPDHVYVDEGVYTATVTVTDDSGPRTSSARIAVTNLSPAVRLSVPGDVAPGTAVSMRAFAEDPGTADVLTYHWTFGDGASANGRLSDHTYGSAGAYTVTLAVEDGDGGRTVVTRAVAVRQPLGDRDTRGTDFWLAFPTNYSGPPAITLFIAAEAATSGRVDVPGLGFTTPFSVTPGQVSKVSVPADAQLTLDNDGPKPLAVHVTAAEEVTVYGLNRIQYTTDAFVGIPTDALGDHYRVMSYSPAFGGGPEAAVVATRNGTTVSVTPSAETLDGHSAGVPYDVRLDLGDAYQLRSAGDLTGSEMRSTGPVAVFGAHTCANVPITAPYCDHLVEQMPPTETWGRSFVTVPLATRSGGDTFRILAEEDATNVTVNGVKVATLRSGAFHEQLISGPAAIAADKPVLVAQYSNGSTFDTTISDPFMVIVPPFEQFQAAYTVSTPSEGFRSNFLNLVVPAAGTAGIRLDGELLPKDSFLPVGDSGFFGRHVDAAPGDHRIVGTTPFGVVVYGFDSDDSYGYGGGFGIGRIASVAELRLTPAQEILDIGTSGCVDAHARTSAGADVPGVRVDFKVTGANDASDFATTDPKGLARFCYSGTHTGSDTIQAAIGALASTAAKSWRGANRPPAAADDTAGGSQDAAVSIPVSTLTANDSDPDGDPLTVTAVSDATQGSARLAGGSITFTPAAGFAGTASFRYTVGDGRGGNAVATVRLAIKPAEPGGDVAGTSASSLLLACTDRKVVLEDVVAMKDRVQLVGVADRSFIGKRVEIVFAPTGKVVARATVLANGTFSTTAPLPVRSMRKSNRARYLARVGGQRSLNLKLFRRMQVTKLTAANGRVSITGRVIGPLAAKKDRTIVVQRIFSCSKAEEVARVAPRGDGTFTVSVATPKDARAAVYRLQTNVLPDARSRKPVRTFTLPRAVDF